MYIQNQTNQNQTNQNQINQEEYNDKHFNNQEITKNKNLNYISELDEQNISDFVKHTIEIINKNFDSSSKDISDIKNTLLTELESIEKKTIINELESIEKKTNLSELSFLKIANFGNLIYLYNHNKAEFEHELKNTISRQINATLYISKPDIYDTYLKEYAIYTYSDSPINISIQKMLEDITKKEIYSNTNTENQFRLFSIFKLIFEEKGREQSILRNKQKLIIDLRTHTCIEFDIYSNSLLYQMYKNLHLLIENIAWNVKGKINEMTQLGKIDNILNSDSYKSLEKEVKYFNNFMTENNEIKTSEDFLTFSFYLQKLILYIQEKQPELINPMCKNLKKTEGFAKCIVDFLSQRNYKNTLKPLVLEASEVNEINSAIKACSIKFDKVVLKEILSGKTSIDILTSNYSKFKIKADYYFEIENFKTYILDEIKSIKELKQDIPNYDNTLNNYFTLKNLLIKIRNRLRINNSENNYHCFFNFVKEVNKTYSQKSINSLISAINKNLKTITTDNFNDEYNDLGMLDIDYLINQISTSIQNQHLSYFFTNKKSNSISNEILCNNLNFEKGTITKFTTSDFKNIDFSKIGLLHEKIKENPEVILLYIPPTKLWEKIYDLSKDLIITKTPTEDKLKTIIDSIKIEIIENIKTTKKSYINKKGKKKDKKKEDTIKTFLFILEHTILETEFTFKTIEPILNKYKELNNYNDANSFMINLVSKLLESIFIFTKDKFNSSFTKHESFYSQKLYDDIAYNQIILENCGGDLVKANKIINKIKNHENLRAFLNNNKFDLLINCLDIFSAEELNYFTVNYGIDIITFFSQEEGILKYLTTIKNLNMSKKDINKDFINFIKNYKASDEILFRLNKLNVNYKTLTNHYEILKTIDNSDLELLIHIYDIYYNKQGQEKNNISEKEITNFINFLINLKDIVFEENQIKIIELIKSKKLSSFKDCISQILKEYDSPIQFTNWINIIRIAKKYNLITLTPRKWKELSDNTYECIVKTNIDEVEICIHYHPTATKPNSDAPYASNLHAKKTNPDRYVYLDEAQLETDWNITTSTKTHKNKHNKHK
ncbi:MAG: hypothetical protein N4A49_15580 [Marinifilaceae bacterium]|jgi:hypothetical protein|nr:hypothetical protein [Marinifilaceae bacterium]